jgi:hypothetical protein
MVGPAQTLSVDTLAGPRWELALELLEKRDGIVNLRGLLLYTDPPTAKVGQRLHVEFDCPFDPSQVGKAPHEQLKSIAERELRNAREIIAAACDEDDRFASVVAQSGVVYEFVHRYGMGGLLVATAGRSGDLTWR